MQFPNIKYKGNLSKDVVNASDKYEFVSLYKDREYFEESKPLDNYIKAIERMVRTSKEYDAFVGIIKNKLGLNFCQVMNNITSDVATIEMHHGPLFTLYDYIDIFLYKYLLEGKKINTFRIADDIINEHYNRNIQVVMLAITNHEAVHNRDVFLNVKQGVGDVSNFIEKYQKFLKEDYKYRIYNYIQLCKNVDSFDYGFLDIARIEPLIKL